MLIKYLRRFERVSCAQKMGFDHHFWAYLYVAETRGMRVPQTISCSSEITVISIEVDLFQIYSGSYPFRQHLRSFQCMLSTAVPCSVYQYRSFRLRGMYVPGVQGLTFLSPAINIIIRSILIKQQPQLQCSEDP